MAKFVEWANSLLGRFEEQVRTRFPEATNGFSHNFPIFQDVAHEKSINPQVIFIFFFFPPTPS